MTVHRMSCDCDRCLVALMCCPLPDMRRQGWEGWYCRDAPGLKALLERRCQVLNCPELSEDLLHDCFMIGYRNVVRGAFVEQGKSLAAYLAGIAKNLLRETRHAQRREPPPDSAIEPEAVVANGLSIEEQLLLSETLELVQRACDRQPPLRKTVVQALYGRGKSSAELAREIQTSAGNARIIALRAVTDMQGYLAEQYDVQLSPHAIRSCLEALDSLQLERIAL